MIYGGEMVAAADGGSVHPRVTERSSYVRPKGNSSVGVSGGGEGGFVVKWFDKRAVYLQQDC